MASSKKTANLGLNNWTETDCPKRSDFVSDNQIIDNLVGNHIKDSSLHLTSSEKDRVSVPFDINTYYGTGEASTELQFNYSPKFVIVCKKNSPLQTSKSSNIVINAAIASTVGVSGGIKISNKTVTVKQSATAENGIMYNLNDSNSEYMIITFK